MRFRLITTSAALVAAPNLGAQATLAKTPEQLKIAGRLYAEWVVAARAGTEVSLIEERMIKRNKADQYWRIAKYSTLTEPLVIRVVVSPDGKYAGLGVGPLSQVPPVDPPAP